MSLLTHGVGNMLFASDSDRFTAGSFESVMRMLISQYCQSFVSIVGGVFKPEFFEVSSFQALRLKHLRRDVLHIILSLSAVQIYEFHILMFIYSPSMG